MWLHASVIIFNLTLHMHHNKITGLWKQEDDGVHMLRDHLQRGA